MGLQRCVNSFFTRKLSSSAKTLQVVKSFVIITPTFMPRGILFSSFHPLVRMFVRSKGLFIRFTARAFRKLLSIYIVSYFPFCFEGRMWDLIPLIQESPGVGRNTLFLSSPHLCFVIVFICDLFVSRDDPLMS